jgi:hypothetical protein
MKQTAVEWLVEQLNEKIDFIPLDKWDMIRDIIQQAKAMEKEQIIKFAEAFATSDAIYCSGEFALEKDAEHYYNETYGGQA